MKTNKTILIFSGVALAVALLFGFMYFDMKKENILLRQMARGSAKTADGRRETDPYLANEVKNRILKGYGEMNKLYKEYLAKNPKVKEGNIVADWQIDTDGKTISPEIVASNFNDPEFEEAVIKTIAGWRFPEPAIKKYVAHTFRFKMEKKEKK